MESTIVVASNRGPVSFDHDASGALTSQRGAGGLVTALSGVFFRDETTWVAAAMSDGDREVAHEGYEIDPDSHQRVRFVVIPPERYDAYYNQMANRILWFLHHYLWDTARTPVFDEATEATWQEFVEANRSFAIALAEEGDRDPVYLIQDYHLALVPGLLARAPSGRAHRPLHAHAVRRRDVPPHPPGAHARRDPARDGGRRRGRVPGPAVGRELPPVGAGTARMPRPARRTLRDRRSSGHCRAAFPVAVSAHSIRETATRPEIKQVRQELKEWKGDAALLLRVDRLEPSKNILRGFLAYELFLRSNPSWQGRVKFLALFSPSREALPEYQAYGDDCLVEVERINKELSTEDWQPIEVRIQEDYGYAVGAYGLYDVLLVNPVYDGMNLVAMEGPLVNRHGALVLSRNAGAYGRLGKHAITVNPFDIHETADAIRDASGDARGGTETPRARDSPGRSRRTRRRNGSHRNSRRSTRSGLRATERVTSVARSSTISETPSTTMSAAATRSSGVSAPRTATFTTCSSRPFARARSSASNANRSAMSSPAYSAARSPSLVDDAVDRPFLEGEPGRHELDDVLARERVPSSPEQRARPSAVPAPGPPRSRRESPGSGRRSSRPWSPSRRPRPGRRRPGPRRSRRRDTDPGSSPYDPTNRTPRTSTRRSSWSCVRPEITATTR